MRGLGACGGGFAGTGLTGNMFCGIFFRGVCATAPPKSEHSTAHIMNRQAPADCPARLHRVSSIRRAPPVAVVPHIGVGANGTLFVSHDPHVSPGKRLSPLTPL